MSIRMSYAFKVGTAMAATTVVILTIVYLVGMDETSVLQEEGAAVGSLQEEGEAEGTLQEESQAAVRAKLAEATLRDWALRLPKPQYPAASVAAGASGVAVASILIEADGSVVNVTLVESPDLHIGEAVEAALSDALFEPVSVDGTPVMVEGTMTYYFQIDDSGSAVLDPDEISSSDAPADSPVDTPPAEDENQPRLLVVPLD